MEHLGVLREVDYYNDSKATNNLAHIICLKSFKSPVIWIAGGLDRGQSLDELIPHMDRVKMIITFGETKIDSQTWHRRQAKRLSRKTLMMQFCWLQNTADREMLYYSPPHVRAGISIKL